MLTGYEWWWRKARSLLTPPTVEARIRSVAPVATESVTVRVGELSDLDDRIGDLERLVDQLDARLDQRVKEGVARAISEGRVAVEDLRREMAETEHKRAWRPGVAAVLVLVRGWLGTWMNVCALAQP